MTAGYATNETEIMPSPVALPFPPLVLLDRDGALAEADVTATLVDRLAGGVSVCLRSAAGPERRGGYYFHFKRMVDGRLALSSFDTPDVAILNSMASLVAFMNHASGRFYCDEMWLFSQRLNLRTDPD